MNGVLQDRLELTAVASRAAITRTARLLSERIERMTRSNVCATAEAEKLACPNYGRRTG